VISIFGLGISAFVRLFFKNGIMPSIPSIMMQRSQLLFFYSFDCQTLFLYNSKLNTKLTYIKKRDLCIDMNNHQNAIFHQFKNCLKTPLALLGVDLKNSKINKICHFANYSYLCKGL